MTSLDDGRRDWDYQPFRPLSHWSTSRVDDQLWRSTVERLTAARDALDEAARVDEVQRSLRAAALNTGALEGLHNADRGLTVTVVTDAAWQAAIDRVEGPRALTFVEAALDAFDLVFDVATGQHPLTEALIRRIHEVVTGPQGTYEAQTALGPQQVTLAHGAYKTLPNHVVEPDGTKHAYAPPDLVRDEMARLVGELTVSAAEGTHPIVLAAFAHHAFVAVHPFADGNGRVARLLASIYTLRAASVPLMIWADQSLEYRTALKRADRGDPQGFVDFVFDRTTDAMNLMEDRLRARGLPSVFAEPDEARRRQHEAAQRLTAVVERAVDEAAEHPPGGVTVGIRSAPPFAIDGTRSQPFPGRRVVLTTPRGQLSVHFGVVVPRERTDTVEVVVEQRAGVRAIRSRDIVPELRDAAVEQAQAFVRRMLTEAAAELLG